MMLCEVAAWCKSNGITLWDAMVSLYETYGYYKEGLETMTLKGMDGAEKIQSMMNEMRNNPPKKIGAWDVLALRDYKKDTRTDMTSGEVTPTGLPESNVLYYELSNNAWCCVRPSEQSQRSNSILVLSERISKIPKRNWMSCAPRCLHTQENKLYG